jgi:hydroxypyruvate reductase
MQSRLRQHARRIFRAALRAAAPDEAVLRFLSVRGGKLIVGARRYDLDAFRSIFVIGGGKAGAPMARAVERVLGRRVTTGLLNVKYGHVAPLRRVALNECGHPVPDANGLAGVQRIAAIASAAGPGDLVICLISGGASALMPAPADPVTLAEKQETTRLLLACGANIHEMNALRKHLSTLKGGQLARLAAPATVIALLLSDVIGDDLSVIGSGPASPDPSAFESARAILEKYALLDRVPLSVRERIEQGCAGAIPETPKPGDPLFRRVQIEVVGSNRLAVDAMVREAKVLGYRTLVLSTLIEGETRDVARMHAAILRECLLSGRPLKPPACIISGGETTVTLRGSGLGGRNQEFTLAAALDIEDLPDALVLSGGTDGTDGPTDAAGAIADGRTISRAAAAGLSARDYLARNDSYHFFDSLGDLIKTGPTNTNVMDVRLMLAGRAG